jgi:hypothetical protein
VVIEVLDSQIDAIQHAIDVLIASDPVSLRKGRPPAQLQRHRPEECSDDPRPPPRNRHARSPQDRRSRRCRPDHLQKRLVHKPRQHRRRPQALRDTLFTAALSASSHNPTFITFRNRLKANGKPHKLIIVAVIRKLIVTLNAMIKAKTPSSWP